MNPCQRALSRVSWRRSMRSQLVARFETLLHGFAKSTAWRLVNTSRPRDSVCAQSGIIRGNPLAQYARQLSTSISHIYICMRVQYRSTLIYFIPTIFLFLHSKNLLPPSFLRISSSRSFVSLWSLKFAKLLYHDAGRQPTPRELIKPSQKVTERHLFM